MAAFLVPRLRLVNVCSADVATRTALPQNRVDTLIGSVYTVFSFSNLRTKNEKRIPFSVFVFKSEVRKTKNVRFCISDASVALPLRVAGQN